jgi:hypothetical protein
VQRLSGDLPHLEAALSVLWIPACSHPREVAGKGVSTSTKARSLAYARKQGWVAGDTERWVPNPKHPAGGQRRDLFGFCDLLVVSEGGDVRFINAVGAGQVNNHLRKWEGDKDTMKAIRALIFASCNIEIWMWRKLKRPDARGAKRELWSVKIHLIDMGGDGTLDVVHSWEG